MKQAVPEELRRLALRKLWRSDPVLANVDGLNDYDLDYTKLGADTRVTEALISQRKDKEKALRGDGRSEESRRREEAEAAGAKGAQEAEPATAEAGVADSPESPESEEPEADKRDGEETV
jgi:hypothetical protein